MRMLWTQVDNSLTPVILVRNVCVPATKSTVERRAMFTFDFPQLPTPEHLDTLSALRGMVDLDQVICVTGYGEVGRGCARSLAGSLIFGRLDRGVTLEHAGIWRNMGFSLWRDALNWRG